MTPLDARRAHDLGDACDRLFAGLEREFGAMRADARRSGLLRTEPEVSALREPAAIAKKEGR